MLEPESRYLGSLIGLAVGDALGAPFEGMPPGTFRFTGIVGDTRRGLGVGSWTDDTSMALCLAASLVECGGFDLRDQCERYAHWLTEGYMSSTGECFGIGRTTIHAIERFMKTGDPRSGLTSSNSAGNGSIMRLAPVPLFFAKDPARAIALSAESSLSTHAEPRAVDACRLLGALIVDAVHALPKADLLALKGPAGRLVDPETLHPEIAAIARGSFTRKAPPEIVGSGYVVHSLEAALWCLHSTARLTDGMSLAINLGHDTDTTASIYGQLAGAVYGLEAFPCDWTAPLKQIKLIAGLAQQIYQLSGM